MSRKTLARGEPARPPLASVLDSQHTVNAVGLVSPCGFGNLGDAAIQHSVIRNLRERQPHVHIVAFTLNPSDTAARHGVPAYPARRMPWKGAAARRPVFPPSEWTSPPTSPSRPQTAPSEESSEAERHGGDPPGGLKAFVKSRAPRLFDLVRRTVSPLRSRFKSTVHEVRHIRDLFRWLRPLDLLVISGGGQLDDTWGGPWRQPYLLWKFPIIARLLGVRVVCLSVGGGSLEAARSRWFARNALSRCEYSSFRDVHSADVARALGLPGPHTVVPDLAYGLPLPEFSSSQWPGGEIGLAPMAYADPHVWPEKAESLHRDYLERFARLASSLEQRAGASTCLFATHVRMDARALDEVRNRLRGPRQADPAVVREPTVEELLQSLQHMRLVVTSRLHGVILSSLAGVPMIALSYDRKVRDLMVALGMEEYCHDIRTFDPSEIADLGLAMLQDSEDLREELRARTDGFSSEVIRQFDAVFGIPKQDPRIE